MTALLFDNEIFVGYTLKKKITLLLFVVSLQHKGKLS